MGRPGVSGAIFSLVGVLIGSSTALLGQYLVARVQARTEAFEREELRRTERKETIVAFLAAAQRVESLIDALRREEVIDREAATGPMNDVWLAKKVAELVCSLEFAQAAHNYAATLEVYLLDTTTDRWSDRKRSDRWEALESARRDLGNADGPIERRLPRRRRYFEQRATDSAAARSR